MPASRDYYEILGVNPTASQDDIKRAYRNLARKYHPDANASPDATDRFKEIQAAYEVLSDDEKRDQYNNLGHEAFTGNGSGFPDGFGANPFGDIFEMFFNQGSGQRNARDVARGDDLREDIEISLEEAAAGADKTIRYARMETCESCKGSGASPGSEAETCPQCRGQGTVTFNRNTILGTVQTIQTCSRCRGTGKVILSPCHICSGNGRVRAVTERSVKIPAGVESGQKMRINGTGDAGERGGPAGDLYIVIHVLNHKLFERHGNDIVCEVKISFARATLGGEIHIPVLNGTEELKLEEGTQPGQVYTLRGKGIPDLNGRGKGDQHVVIKVQIPTHLTHEQRTLMEQIAETLGETHEAQEHPGLLGRLFGKH